MSPLAQINPNNLTSRQFLLKREVDNGRFHLVENAEVHAGRNDETEGAGQPRFKKSRRGVPFMGRQLAQICRKLFDCVSPHFSLDGTPNTFWMQPRLGSRLGIFTQVAK